MCSGKANVFPSLWKESRMSTGSQKMRLEKMARQYHTNKESKIA